MPLSITLRVALSFVVLCCLAVASTAWAEDAPPVGKISKAAEAPKIDGVLDDAVWRDATVTKVQYLYGKTGQLNEKPSMLTRYTWDDQYLYIGYETFDDNLLSLGTGEKQGPAGNQREGTKIADNDVKVDVVEFFISLGDEHFFWELHHNAANQFNDVFCLVVDDHPIGKSSMARYGIHFGNQDFVEDDADAKTSLAIATKLKAKADGTPSTLNKAGDADTGYVGEMRLPWIGLGTPLKNETWIVEKPAVEGGPTKRYHGPWKMAGTEIRILSVMQNGDAQIRYNHDSPTLAGGWFHKGYAHWPRYELVDGAKP
jgi:Carbohydrate family 9 binding domain-like